MGLVLPAFLWLICRTVKNFSERSAYHSFQHENLYCSGIRRFLVGVPPDVIYLLLCTPKVVCI
jgi:hypothetical protein